MFRVTSANSGEANPQLAAFSEYPLPTHRETTAAPPAPPPPPPAPVRKVSKSSAAAQLRSQVTAALSASGAKVVGAAVEVKGLGRVVNNSSNLQLLPASTQKLYTASTALKKLGPGFRYSTEVRRIGEVGLDGTLHGNLVLVASGDPFLTKGDLDALATAVSQAGIKKVDGELYADDTHYDRARTAPGWKPSYMPKESGPLSAFAVDLNKWNRDPTFLADPVPANLELFRGSLGTVGVAVTGPSLLGSPLGAKVVASHPSAPLSEILARMLYDSDNFVAELVLKEIGAADGRPTTAGGVDAIGMFGEEMGLGRVQPVDGSGLSLENRTTADHQVDWLVKLADTPTGQVLQKSLPVACDGVGPGWMSHRLCGTPAAGKVSAKTGFLSGVRSLAGYATTASGRRVWFSFLLIEPPGTTQAWTAIDNALVALTSFGS